MGDKTDQADPKPQSLHPVYTVTNIQHKVRVLDGVEVAYPTWVKLFMLHATGYDVVDHIDGSPAPATTAADYASWKKIDAVVLQWIYGTLSNDILVRVLEDKSTAYEAWTRVKTIFLNNKGPRAMALQHELTNITLASMPNLESYCQRIRDLSDQLAAVDCPLSNTQRILHLVNGLPREYDTTASILNQNLPPWEQAVEQLQAEARRIAAREARNPTPVIAAVTSQPDNRRSNNRDNNHRDNNNRDQNNNLRQSNQRRDQNRGQRFNNRGSGNSQQQQPYQAQPPYVPHWAPQQAFGPYWTPPPCPFPTQTWAPQQWGYRPNSRPTSSNTNQAQAHLAGVDPLEPTSLANAVQALSLDSGSRNNEQWHFDTGFHGWHNPESSQQYQ
ncbi:putative RNA-directed DNA polymerase [Helianthus annuus]|nr:putative RNA-directed DNA polymerase [Helianthus annuus]